MNVNNKTESLSELSVKEALAADVDGILSKYTKFRDPFIPFVPVTPIVVGIKAGKRVEKFVDSLKTRFH